VIIFNLLGTNPPGYIYPTNLTQTILAKYDLNGDILRMIEMYFSNLFNQNHDGGIDIQRLRESYDFPEVAKSVKVIDDEHQISVVVKWGDSEKLIAQMQTQEYFTELDWRKLQQFTVNLPKKFTNYIQIGKIDVWTGDYDQKTGIME
jgi:CRISPR-associated endonuclease/helicase Cas3